MPLITRRLVAAVVACASVGTVLVGGRAEASNRCTPSDTVRVVGGVGYACFGPARNLRWVRLQVDRPVVDVATAERPAGELVNSGLFDVAGRRHSGPGPAGGIRCGRKGDYRLGWFYFANVAAWFEYASGEVVVAPMGRSDRWLMEDSLMRDKGLPARRTREPFSGDLYSLPWGWTYEEAPGAFGICRLFPAIADTVVDNGFVTVAGERFTEGTKNGSFSLAGERIGVAQVDMLPDTTPISGASREQYPCAVMPGGSGSGETSDGSVTLWWRYASGLERTKEGNPTKATSVFDSDGLQRWSNNAVAVVVETRPGLATRMCWLVQIKLNP